MATKVTIQMEKTQKILLKRYINKNGKAQQRFTAIVAKKMNNYVPFDTGRLKDMTCTISGTKIIYNAPYAKKQYYSNRGAGKQGTSFGGLRGRLWDKRMWTREGDTIVKSIAEFCGGKAK